MTGTAIAIDLPMTSMSVVVYFGIVLAGCAVVSIADSFAPPEVAMRLAISKAQAIFTQVGCLPVHDSARICLPLKSAQNITQQYCLWALGRYCDAR